MMMSGLKMETVSFSETLAYTDSTRRQNPEEQHQKALHFPTLIFLTSTIKSSTNPITTWHDANCERKRPLDRPRCRWKDNIKMYVLSQRNIV
jgi:hypothetical protein